MSIPRRINVISTASACGKTTLGRTLAERLGVPHIELDALVHGPGWVETPDEELRATLRPLLETDGWVVDGNYREKLGDLVLAKADLVVWLDLPARVWLPRLVRRSLRRVIRREVLWNGNRESLAGCFWGRDSLVRHALRKSGERRSEWPEALSAYPTVRFESAIDVDRFVAGF